MQLSDDATARRRHRPSQAYQLRLYVAGRRRSRSWPSTNLKQICEEHLHGRYEIEIIDLLENPQLAQGDQILAVPTLVRRLPEPIKKIIGDLSNTERVLVGLDLRVAPVTTACHRPRRSARDIRARPHRRRERYVLRLYVTGMTPRSARAVKNLRAICDEYLEGRYDLEVIDIYQQPVLTKGEQIIAAPTLIKKLPLPMRRIIGDMSNRERVLLGLDLVRASDVAGSKTMITSEPTSPRRDRGAARAPRRSRGDAAGDSARRDRRAGRRGPGGNQVYTLHSAEEPYRNLVEQMQEGAVVLTARGDILYCQRALRRARRRAARVGRRQPHRPIRARVRQTDFETLLAPGQRTMSQPPDRLGFARRSR